MIAVAVIAIVCASVGVTGENVGGDGGQYLIEVGGGMLVAAVFSFPVGLLVVVNFVIAPVSLTRSYGRPVATSFVVLCAGAYLFLAAAVTHGMAENLPALFGALGMIIFGAMTAISAVLFGERLMKVPNAAPAGTAKQPSGKKKRDHSKSRSGDRVG